jgi:CRP-like cAMP-binding protein
MSRCVASPKIERDEPVLAGLAPDLRARFYSLMESRTSSAGALLFKALETPEGAFFIHRGRVQLWLDAGEGSRLLHTAGTGEMVGLSSCISGLPYEVTAKCLTRCDFGFIRSRELFSFLSFCPQAWPYIARQLASGLSDANGQVLSLKKR